MNVLKAIVFGIIPSGVALLSGEAHAASEPAKTHIVAVNQVGYLADQPKRFTAPVSPEGSSFVVHEAKGTSPLFTGKVVDHVGDFSAFKPSEAAHHYVVEVSGGSLISATSDPFLVSNKVWTDQFWPAATDFMIDIRAVMGTHPSAYGGGAFRDSTYYAFEGPSMVMLLQADPARVASLPHQLDWAADRKRVLDTTFAYDPKNPESDGALEAARRYYTELAAPAANAPDLVKLIHWAYGYILMRPASRDPSKDPLPSQVHGQHVEQFAYLLRAWPSVAPWLPAEFRTMCHDWAFANWESSGLLEIDPLWDASTYSAQGDKESAGYVHPFKGRHPPGASIAPNLMMYELALEEKRTDAPRYLAAARKQAQWLIDHLDWNDPRTTKGHRMSEFRTMIGLVWFLQHHAAEAPAGLRQKVIAWARVVVACSANQWDFRRYDLDSNWSIPWLNEPGNLLGFTAAALAASWVVEEPALRDRLREIAFAQTDAVFGRNPLRVVGVSFPELGFPEVERGWPIRYKPNTCARLETTRGSISASCGTEFYPYRPESTDFRHAEGWVNYNAAWNVALAYAEFDRTKTAP